MTYDPNIPQPEDDLAVSQGELLTNFGELNTKFGIDHVPFSPPVADSGKHAKVTFVTRTTAPIDPVPDGSQIAMYAKVSGGISELFFNKNPSAPWQVTKKGEILVNVQPKVAANFDGRSTNGTATIHSQFNVTSVQRTAKGKYTVNFAANILDPAGADTTSYFWSVSGVWDTGQIIGGIQPDPVYTNVVKANQLLIQFVDNAGGARDPVRGVVLCWRLQ